MDKTTLLYNFIEENLVETGFLTIEELDKECDLYGFNLKTLENLLFYYTSWRDLNQAQEMLKNGEFYSNM